jgi:hypothetical protein
MLQVSTRPQLEYRQSSMIASLMGNGPFTGVIRDFIFINQKWPSEDPIKLLGTNIVINPGDLDGEYDIEVDIGTSPSDKQSTANQIDMFVQFATQAGIQMGIVDETGVRAAIKSKYRVLGINAGQWMVDEKTFKQKLMQKQQMMMQPQGPPPGGPPQGPPGLLPPPGAPPK